jgi:polyhydroxyalkanoate synthase subunit PhaE
VNTPLHQEPAPEGVPLRTGVVSHAARAVATAAWQVPWALHDRTSARLLRMPGLGLTREVQEKSARALDAWLELVRAGGPYAVLLADAGMRSVPAVARRLAGEAVTRRSRLDGQAVVEALLDGCEDAFHATLESKEYFQAQADLVNAAMLYRGRQRELSAMLMRFTDFASREEVEDVGRMMHGLRRELRALRREVEALAAATGTTDGGAAVNGAGRREREGVRV